MTARSDAAGPGRHVAVMLTIGVLAVGISLHPVLGEPAMIAVAAAAAAAGGALAVVTRRFEYGVLLALSGRPSLDLVQSYVGDRADLPALLGVAFAVVAAAWLLIQPRGVPGTALERSGMVLVAALVVATIGSLVPSVGVPETAGVTAILLMFAVARRLLRTWASVRRLLAATALSAIVPVGFGVFQFVTQRGLFYSVEFDGGRVAGPFVHPSPFAAYLVILGLMGVALLPVLRTNVRLVVGALLTGGGLCLVGTYTRGAWIAAVVGAGVIGMLYSRWALLGLTAIVAVTALAVPNVTARVADLREEDLERLDWEVPQNSLAWRVGYWGTLVTGEQVPRLTGDGPGTVAALSPDGLAPHNDFVKAFVEFGVVGLLAYLAFVGSMLALAVQSLRRTTGPSRSIAVGFTGVVVAFIVMSAVDNLLSQLVVMWFVVAFAAVVWAVQRVPAPRSAL